MKQAPSNLESTMTKKLIVFVIVISARMTIEVGASLECSKPWTVAKVENGTVKCACGSQLHGVVECDPHSCKTRLTNCHCMTHSTLLNTTV